MRRVSSACMVIGKRIDGAPRWWTTKRAWSRDDKDARIYRDTKSALKRARELGAHVLYFGQLPPELGRRAIVVRADGLTEMVYSPSKGRFVEWPEITLEELPEATNANNIITLEHVAAMDVVPAFHEAHRGARVFALELKSLPRDERGRIRP